MNYSTRDEMRLRDNFSRNMQKYMDMQGFDQRELADRAHLSQGTISKIVNGYMSPSVKTAVNISLALNVSVDKLL